MRARICGYLRLPLGPLETLVLGATEAWLPSAWSLAGPMAAAWSLAGPMAVAWSPACHRLPYFPSHPTGPGSQRNNYTGWDWKRCQKCSHQLAFVYNNVYLHNKVTFHILIQLFSI